MMDKGLILVIIGGLLSCTIYGVLIGAPLTLIGAYFLYKTLKNKYNYIEIYSWLSFLNKEFDLDPNYIYKKFIAGKIGAKYEYE